MITKTITANYTVNDLTITKVQTIYKACWNRLRFMDKWLRIKTKQTND